VTSDLLYDATQRPKLLPVPPHFCQKRPKIALCEHKLRHESGRKTANINFYKTFKFKKGVLWAIIAQKEQISGDFI
jgi:hypothetical protein